MSNTSYTTEKFPYSDILSGLTERIRTEKLSPVQAYLEFCKERESRNLSVHANYGSTSITTGGHVYLKSLDRIIEANTRTARLIITQLTEQGSLIGHRMILPVDMGANGWSQSDFLTYWSLTIAGPDHHRLAGFEEKLTKNHKKYGVELDIMNDSKLNREERRPIYARFVDAFVQTIRTTKVYCLPVYSLISLVDPDISIGCWAEKRLAAELGIPLQGVAAVKPANVSEIPPPLGEDLKILVANGSSVLVAPRGSMLTLVGSEPKHN